MSEYIDISRKLHQGVAVWPGDTPFQLEKILQITAGSSVNLTTLTISAHTGTHADAPYHFTEVGERMDEVGLRPYWGRAQVVTVKKEAGALMPADFAGYDLSLAPRLLVHSVAGDVPETIFPAEIVYPSPELAAYLAQAGVILYGADVPSMDAIESKELLGHRALYQHGIAIVENLLLTDVPDGLYEFVAMPLRLVGGDGSPVRAVLRTIRDGE